jgi:hypothetical protein
MGTPVPEQVVVLPNAVTMAVTGFNETCIIGDIREHPVAVEVINTVNVPAAESIYVALVAPEIVPPPSYHW